MSIHCCGCLPVYSENLPDPDVLARDIAENLGSALEQFSTIYQELEEE